MPWPFKSKPSRAAFTIGAYKLEDTSDLKGLTEFSESEYEVMGRQFKNERNFNAPPVEFLGYAWNLMLGTVDGRIYKIAPYVVLQSKQQANPVAMAALQYCTVQYGQPSSQKTGLFIWDTTDGNVILQTGETAAEFGENLFITSSKVSQFERL